MVSNSNSSTVEFDSVEGYFHGSITNPLVGGELVLGSNTKVNGGNITAFMTGGSDFVMSSDKVVFGNYDPNTINLVNIVYHSTGVFIVQIANGYRSNLADTSAPILLGASVEVTAPNVVKLLFNEPVNGSNIGHSVSGSTISSITGWGTAVISLHLSANVSHGDIKTYSYVGGDVADSSSNALATITNFAIVNNVPDGINPLSTNSWYLWATPAISQKTGNNVTSMTDQTGAGNDVIATGSPEYIENGINGKPSVRINGTSGYFTISNFTQGALLLSDYTLYMVFQLTNSAGQGTYHNIIMMGGTTFANAGSNFAQIYVPNNGTVVKCNYPNTDGDQDINIGTITAKHCLITRQGAGQGNRFTFDGGAEIIKSVTYNPYLRNLTIGVFGSNGAKMDLSAIAIGPRISDQGLADLKAYTLAEFGI